jgi:uncharacterized membrane protein YhaH (DUF805 family)
LIKGQPVWPPRKVLTDFGVDKLLAYEALDALKSLIRYGAAGVPKTRVLRQLQQGKDDVQNSIGLRLALCALLSWSAFMLANSNIQPVPASAIWRLGSRLGRKALLLRSGVCGDCAGGGLISGTTVSGILILLLGVLLLLVAILRRLHDMGRGIPTLLIFMALSPVHHFCHWCCSVFREINYPTATACRRTAVVATCCPAACRPHYAGSTAKGAVDPAPC